MTTSIFYGLLSALFWGAGDFSGGLATRRASVYSVIIMADLVGGILLLIIGLMVGERLPSAADLWWGTLAGVGGVVGLIGLYRALATSQMGVASPLSAVIAAILPVIIAIAFEGWPPSTQLAGFLLALIAIWIIAQSGEVRFHWRSLGLPLVAGLGFASFFILFDQVSVGAIYYPLVAARLIAVIMLGGFAWWTGQPLSPPLAQLPLVALVGAADMFGNIFYGLSAQAGRLDVAAVTSSLYPATTGWLAWLILKERLTSKQMVGVGLALVAIVLIAM